ncbi:MAG: DUF1674 domain-containing protein [Alphaproteobacteria bacterium]
MTTKRKIPKDRTAAPSDDRVASKPTRNPPAKPTKEIGGRGGLDPTRYGDWEKGGRAVDF